MTSKPLAYVGQILMQLVALWYYKLSNDSRKKRTAACGSCLILVYFLYFLVDY